MFKLRNYKTLVLVVALVAIASGFVATSSVQAESHSYYGTYTTYSQPVQAVYYLTYFNYGMNSWETRWYTNAYAFQADRNWLHANGYAYKWQVRYR